MSYPRMVAMAGALFLAGCPDPPPPPPKPIVNAAPTLVKVAASIAAAAVKAFAGDKEIQAAPLLVGIAAFQQDVMALLRGGPLTQEQAMRLEAVLQVLKQLAQSRADGVTILDQGQTTDSSEPFVEVLEIYLPSIQSNTITLSMWRLNAPKMVADALNELSPDPTPGTDPPLSDAQKLVEEIDMLIEKIAEATEQNGNGHGK